MTARRRDIMILYIIHYYRRFWEYSKLTVNYYNQHQLLL